MMRVIGWALAIASLVLTLGCTPLSGTHDVELRYRPLAPPGDAAALRLAVMRRLSAARIPADISVDRDGTVRVTIDGDLATRADEHLTWSSGVFIHAVLPGGGARGTRTDLEADLTDRSRGVFVIEPEWATAEGHHEPRYVTRKISASPVGELGAGLGVAWGKGPTLSLRAAPGSRAARALDAARAKEGPLVLVIGRTSLGELSGDPVTLTFGDGLPAYARAERVHALLTSPALPHLTRVDQRALPANVTLAALCLVLPVALSLLWLVFVRRFDRAHPEPAWLVLSTFALGGASCVLALGAEIALASLSPYLHPGLVSMGGRLVAFPLAWLVLTVVVGLVEEGAKLLGALYATRRREFDEPVDGILYGIASSLGFAAVENVRYFALGRLTPPLVIARSFMSVPAHMFFGALWGYALGQRLVRKKQRVFPWLFAAAAAHGLFDALLSTRSAATLAVPLNVALAGVFIVLVRRSLRHGIVTPEMREKAGKRTLFRVGRPRLFYASAGSLVMLAFALFALGATYQVARYRPEIAFIGGSAILLVLLGLAALGVSWAMPLDVVVDGYGITFAGASRAWASVRAARRGGRFLIAECEGGDIDLGPAPAPVLDRISAAIDRERAQRTDP